MTLRDIVYNTDREWLQEVGAEFGIEDVTDSELPDRFIRRDNAIVINVKNRGFPDMEEVFRIVSEKTGIELSRIESSITSGNLFSIFHEDLYSFLKFIDDEYEVTTVQTGRMGGYIGVIDSDVECEFNTDSFETYLDELVQYLENEEYTVNHFLTDDDELIESEVVYLFDKLLSWKSPDEYMRIKPADYTMLEEIRDLILSTADEWEKPDRWVETIIANEWWD